MAWKTDREHWFWPLLAFISGLGAGGIILFAFVFPLFLDVVLWSFLILSALIVLVTVIVAQLYYPMELVNGKETQEIG